MSTQAELRPHPFTGWLVSRPPVVHQAQQVALFTLADLARPEARERLVSALPSASSRRAVALQPLHLAVAAVTAGLVAPLAHDRVELVVSPGQLGAVLSEDLELDAVWVGSAAPIPRPADPHRVGVRVMELLAPIAEQARRQGHISGGTLEAWLRDSLAAGCGRLQRARRVPGDPSWVAAFLEGTGLHAASSAPTVLVQADQGPPIEVQMRRVCCVLANRPSAQCCPTCPTIRDPGVRQQRVTAWLEDVDDTDFQSLTGRSRYDRLTADSA